MLYSETVMLDTRHRNLLIMGLILLLGVQLTGLTCLGEWQVGPDAALTATASHYTSPDDGVTDDDGCPCHVVFQSVSLAAPEIPSPITDDVSLSPTLHVPTFVVFLFHPPLSV